MRAVLKEERVDAKQPMSCQEGGAAAAAAGGFPAAVQQKARL